VWCARLWTGSTDGKVYCLNASTGEAIWPQPSVLGGPVASASVLSPDDSRRAGVAHFVLSGTDVAGFFLSGARVCCAAWCRQAVRRQPRRGGVLPGERHRPCALEISNWSAGAVGPGALRRRFHTLHWQRRLCRVSGTAGLTGPLFSVIVRAPSNGHPGRDEVLWYQIRDQHHQWPAALDAYDGWVRAQWPHSRPTPRACFTWAQLSTCSCHRESAGTGIGISAV
jgi:hypothetical protein